MGLDQVLAGLLTLAKEMGKGGGGSTEDPTVCMSLLPIGLGVVLVGVQAVRRRILRPRLEAGRPLRLVS